MTPLKIAIFSGSIPSTTFIEHLIEGVSKTHNVLVFGVKHTPKSYSSANVIVYETPRSHIKNLIVTGYRTIALLCKRPKDLPVLFRELKRLDTPYDQWIWFSKWLPIIVYRPDILHLQWAKDIAYYAFLKRELGIKLILSLRGAHINYSPIADPKLANIYKEQFPIIDAFHAVSQAIGVEAQKYGASPERIKGIHSPIPDQFFKAFQHLKKTNNTEVKLVSVGRFHWIKGVNYMLDAIYLLKQQGIQVTYTIIGPDNFSESILFQIHQLGLQEQVRLQPAVPQDVLIKELQTHDVLVLPSLKEGIANVVLEAMAVGLPVVSTDCGGMAEVVVPGKTGWLVPVRDPEALAQAIQNIMQTSETTLQEITTNAHQFVKTHFNAEDAVKQFLELYEKC